MINIAICDDDKKIVEQIKKYIMEYKKAESKVKTYSSGEELLEAKLNFEIIFLDIDMTGINGIETAKKIRNYDKSVKIVYVTSFIDYVNMAFEVHAFGYLNKPIKKEQIYKQLAEALEYLKEEKQEDYIEFVTLEGVIRLSPKQIYYFEYVNRKVKIKTLKKTYMMKEKIAEVADKMEKYGFLMPHKSFTVNLFYIRTIKGYDIFMTDESIIPLSQKKSTEFREQFNIFLENHI